MGCPRHRPVDHDEQLVVREGDRVGATQAAAHEHASSRT